MTDTLASTTTYWILRFDDGTYDAQPDGDWTVPRRQAYPYPTVDEARAAKTELVDVAGRRATIVHVTCKTTTRVKPKRKTRAELEAEIDELKKVIKKAKTVYVPRATPLFYKTGGVSVDVKTSGVVSLPDVED